MNLLHKILDFINQSALDQIQGVGPVPHPPCPITLFHFFS